MAIGPRFPDVLDGAKQGQESAFNVLYREFNPALIRYFRARARREAEDLTAEAWLLAARDLRDFHGDEAGFRAWLVGIAHALLAGHRLQPPHHSDPVDPAALERLVTGGGPDAPMLESEAAQAVINRICTVLSPDQGDVILLRLVVGLSIAETAEVMDKSVGAVRVLQHRALHRLSREFSVEGIRL
ncbi:MAG TPA: sigma-70 family RNA polymerase sigma factor [Acidimicrobiales bacterium]|nr:sigma-70 family RNA polymerase sigma factor [Acidimicrobiales bacterium]